MRIIARINLMKFIILSSLFENGDVLCLDTFVRGRCNKHLFRLLSHSLILIFIYNNTNAF